MYVGVAAQAVKLTAHISGNSLGMVSFLFDCGLRGVKFLPCLPFLVEGVFILGLRRLCQRKADFGGLVRLPSPVLRAAVGLPCNRKGKQQGGGKGGFPVFQNPSHGLSFSDGLQQRPSKP